MEFEWDEKKARANLAKHRIDFEDAIRIFETPILEERSDRNDEARWKAIGDLAGAVIAVVYTKRGKRRRLISARRAKRNEREAYRAAYPVEPDEGTH